MTLVLGISEDKDARAMLRVLAPLARRLVLTAASSHRAAAPTALAAALPPGTVPHEIAASPAEALALAARDPGHPIRCVAGSLFLVGDVLRHLAGGDKPCRVEKAAASMDFLL
jgi:folylpolyglutamate synthase/dihydropteroate synthase